MANIVAVLLSVIVFSSVSATGQVIQIRDARTASAEEIIRVADQLPQPVLVQMNDGDVTLTAGLFRERRELTKAYVMRLKTEDLLQNHLLEAGVRTEKIYEHMHQGWESPQCQLRGHFAGHWLSAAARFAAIDHDALLAARCAEVVRELERCQRLNHGQWVGSIPEKYFDILSEGKESIWSPQYTLHKTMMGLFDAYTYGGDKTALAIEEHAADWFLNWTEKQIKLNRSSAIYSGECCGMLGLWADLYGATKNPNYLTLASRYAMPDIFRQLLAGGDPLTNNHANASIPWIEGAARIYEVTGDTRYRDIVQLFWKQAVESRGMFATTGNNAGEYWIPPQQYARFLGNRTQEHCTVYNMIRVAEFLFRWTGDSHYADYIERALYNGILAQQNPYTGMVCYFLPLQPGAKKVWGTETHDFWCCHGTLVQAQAMYEGLIYYRSQDSVTVSQFIPSQMVLQLQGGQVRIQQKTDTVRDTSDFVATDEVTHFTTEVGIASEKSAKWTLRIRRPQWAIGQPVVRINNETVKATVSKNGFIEIDREWKNDRVQVTFAKKLVRESLPGDNQRFAFLDGPVVLAAITDKEPELSADSAPLPQYEHQYVDGREWQSGHYLVRTRSSAVALKPLYEVADENYSVYFSEAR